LVALLVGASVLPMAARPSAARPATAAPAAGAATSRATIAYWVDGDSVHVRTIGLPVGARTLPVRLIGIDAPETTPGEHAERHARRFNRSLEEIIALGRRARTAAQQLAPPGTVVFLERDVVERDPHRRALAYAWLADGRMVNEELVRAGWAMTLTIPPNVKHAERFTAAQREARAARTGIWEP
jgi:micrococcal nuclease